jgi:surface antigen
MLPLILNSFLLIQINQCTHLVQFVLPAADIFQKNKNWFNANGYLQAIHTYTG